MSLEKVELRVVAATVQNLGPKLPANNCSAVAGNVSLMPRITKEVIMRRFATTLLLIIVSSGAIIVSSGAVAQVGGYFKVKIVQSAAGRYGGCAAWLSPDPFTDLIQGSSCTPRWVTFDCEGQFVEAGSSKTAANVNFSNAQLAMITDSVAFVEIYSNLSDDGYCYANRVDVFVDDAVPPGVNP